MNCTIPTVLNIIAIICSLIGFVCIIVPVIGIIVLYFALLISLVLFLISFAITLYLTLKKSNPVNCTLNLSVSLTLILIIGVFLIYSIVDNNKRKKSYIEDTSSEQSTEKPSGY